MIVGSEYRIHSKGQAPSNGQVKTIILEKFHMSTEDVNTYSTSKLSLIFSKYTHPFHNFQVAIKCAKKLLKEAH